jgi:hypothetical protein
MGMLHCQCRSECQNTSVDSSSPHIVHGKVSWRSGHGCMGFGHDIWYAMFTHVQQIPIRIYKKWILFSLPMAGTAYLCAILASSIYMICCICLGIEKGWFQVPCDMNLAFLLLHADSMRKWNGHLTMYSLYKVLRCIYLYIDQLGYPNNHWQ